MLYFCNLQTLHHALPDLVFISLLLGDKKFLLQQQAKHPIGAPLVSKSIL